MAYNLKLKGMEVASYIENWQAAEILQMKTKFKAFNNL